MIQSCRASRKRFEVWNVNKHPYVIYGGREGTNDMGLLTFQDRKVLLLSHEFRVVHLFQKYGDSNSPVMVSVATLSEYVQFAGKGDLLLYHEGVPYLVELWNEQIMLSNNLKRLQWVVEAESDCKTTTFLKRLEWVEKETCPIKYLHEFRTLERANTERLRVPLEDYLRIKSLANLQFNESTDNQTPP